MKSVKRFCIIILTFNMIFLTGCWNYREVEDVSMVSGFAIDKGRNGKKYHLTFEFLDLTEEKQKSKLLESDGDTLFEAARNSIAKSEKQLFFSHSKVVIISKDIAKDGLIKVLDFLFRDREIRLTSKLVISKADTAAEIIKQKPVTDELACMEIANSLEKNQEHLEKTPDVKLYQANSMLSDDGISLTLPAVKISKNDKESIVELDGTAVFKQDKLQGYLNTEETKYLLYVQGKISGGLLEINDRTKDVNTTIEVLYNETKVKPVVSGNDLSMDINLTTNVVWAENQSDNNSMGQARIKQIENETSMNLENNIKKLIKKVQKEYNCDVFGFGSTVSKYQPKYWKEVKGNWQEMFPHLKVKVSSNVQLVNTECTRKKAEVDDIG